MRPNQDRTRQGSVMLKRRLLFSLPLLAAVAGRGGVAHADPLDQAGSFIQQAGDQLTAIINGSAPLAARQAQLQEIVNRVVDVDNVARFCLGRFWRIATPEQQAAYLSLFHRVLMTSITSKIGEYQGVSVVLGKPLAREGDVLVNTTINRPGNPSSRVDWLVSSDSGSPKIVDVIAEGVSMRQTQRSDYLSYLSQHGNNVQALIDAMKQQTGD